jgi:hypothetical protein
MEFDPGEAFQFDWTPEYAIINNVSFKVHLAVVTLCHSRMSFIRAYPRETTEMVLDAHVKAFSFFGGNCARGIYDNMKTAVIKIHKGKKRDWQNQFDLMSSHYLFEHEACTPYQPQEKGRVERRIGVVQDDFFRPAPKASSLEELNQKLEDEFMKRARTRIHPEIKDKTVWEVFQEEQKSLIIVQREFDAYVDLEARVSKTQLVQYDRNNYSVPLSGPVSVGIRIYADKIIFYYKGQVIAEHQRVFGRDKMVTNFEHYLPALKKKPGALRNGKPFKEENLPSNMVDLYHRMKESCKDADRQFVDILCAVSEHGLDDVDCACEIALNDGMASKSVVLNILNRTKAGPLIEKIPEPEHLKLENPPSADCLSYNILLKGSYNEQERSDL